MDAAMHTAGESTMLACLFDDDEEDDQPRLNSPKANDSTRFGL